MMTYNHSIIFACSIILTFVGCQTDDVPVSSVSVDHAINEISKQSMAFSSAYVKGDVDALMATYTSDAVIFPPNSSAISGDSLLRRYWTLPEGRTVTHHKMTPDGIQVEGNMASDHGVYEISGSNSGNDWGPSRGKYVVVWKFESDGVWRISLDMWNSLPND